MTSPERNTQTECRWAKGQVLCNINLEVRGLSTKWSFFFTLDASSIKHTGNATFIRTFDCFNGKLPRHSNSVVHIIFTNINIRYNFYYTHYSIS